MARPDPAPTPLDRDLADLKLLEIAKHYRAVLDEAARKGSSMLEVLAILRESLTSRSAASTSPTVVAALKRSASNE